MASPGLLELNQASWDREVPAQPLPVLAVFWADWCMPCRTLLPRIDEAAARHAGRVRFATVDVDTAPHLVLRFAIKGLPTLVVLRRGLTAFKEPSYTLSETRESLKDTKTWVGAVRS